MTFVEFESQAPEATLLLPPPYCPNAELKESVQTPELPFMVKEQ